MNSIRISLILMLFTVCHLTAAQVISKDSIAALENQVHQLKRTQRLNKLRIELSGLQNRLDQAAGRARQSQQKAISSAARNALVADSFATGPEDGKLARRARKSARKAVRATARCARANMRLDQLHSQIECKQAELTRLEEQTGK